MAKTITDMETWLIDGDYIFRYLVYKKMFTPYEQQKAFMDETVYEDERYELCKVEEAIDTGNDWLLGLRIVDEDGRVSGITKYYRLGEIRLARFDNDQDIQLYEEDEEVPDEL